MSRFALDALIVLTWCFPDEEARKAQEISERIVTGDTVVVPAFWRHEILNALLYGERRKRITRDLAHAFIADLARLPVEVDAGESHDLVFNTTQALCRRHGLTAYDAAYLEIAMRRGCPLATADDDLKNAAIAEGVRLLLRPIPLPEAKTARRSSRTRLHNRPNTPGDSGLRQKL